MIKFTAWDIFNEVFYRKKDDETQRKFLDRILCAEEGENGLTYHAYVGREDIEDKEIYADSSIVEFDYIYFETIGKQSDKAKVKGYFTFNSESLAYDLRFFHHWVDYMPNYWINMCMKKENIKRASNFKIIDTIQENKLGLIGDKDGN